MGRTSAGGLGDEIDLKNDGKKDVVFDRPCAFILQLKEGRVTALETDRATTATIGKRMLELAPFTPSKVE